VTKEFEEHGTIKEKYDVQRRESDVEAGIKFGYARTRSGSAGPTRRTSTCWRVAARTRKPAASRTYPFAGSLADRAPEVPVASR